MLRDLPTIVLEKSSLEQDCIRAVDTEGENVNDEGFQ